jgi:hypothetical protein
VSFHAQVAFFISCWHWHWLGVVDLFGSPHKRTFGKIVLDRGCLCDFNETFVFFRKVKGTTSKERKF